VSVDTQTGQINVHKLVGAHDVGFAVNPMIVEGQIEGGLIQGLGYATTEEIMYSEAGRQNNNNIQYLHGSDNPRNSGDRVHHRGIL